MSKSLSELSDSLIIPTAEQRVQLHRELIPHLSRRATRTSLAMDELMTSGFISTGRLESVGTNAANLIRTMGRYLSLVGCVLVHEPIPSKPKFGKYALRMIPDNMQGRDALRIGMWGC